MHATSINPISTHRAPDPAPAEEPVPEPHPVPVEEPVPDHNPSAI